MRAIRLTILIISASLASDPSYAIEPNDTMAAWRSASKADKDKLVAEILKREGREDASQSVLRCLDDASSVPGHDGLSIMRVVEVCEKASGDPV